MNKGYALHWRIYTRTDLSAPELAEAVLRRFADHEQFAPDLFGPIDTQLRPFTAGDLSAAAAMLGETEMSLVLKRKRPRWNAYLNWQRKRRRPWFWTLDLGTEWLKDDMARDAARFVTDLCDRSSALFAAGALTEDWFEKHDVLDEKTGALRQRLGASFEVAIGLPGIYWYDYFGPELLAHFGPDRIADIDGAESIPADKGEAILLYSEPDSHDSAWRREREQALVAKLGPDYFFDLANAARPRPKRRTPVPDVTDAKTLRG